MNEKLTGEINLTHNISPNLDATIKHTTDDYSRLTFDCQINKNTDIEVSTDTEGQTKVSLNVKI
ncbi:hypothetical protein SPSIL_009210 [Sporomusa silvacetica DSM 10669]|uniref:Uncharacterized protein n=1 Tax=Sporomusa silvacetica DSM 10669 TaxID=1123289 RepID=A0ABZ3IH46_9FIRM|nr:hypothetical protein [Sporomusa silvacetica]OZC13119.1 hypothetical protein SPSIL_55750 [Sporomusa silvacetica DSM 10669]